MRSPFGKYISHLKRQISLQNIIVFGVSIAMLLAGSLVIWSTTLTIPDLRSFEERRVSQSAKIYDRTGKILLYNLSDDATRTIVPLSEISRNIRNATVAIEDAEFYEHYGIKPTAIIRAVLSNILIILHLSDGYTQGGSTITQQVVKNSLLTTDKTITRKLKEWVLALKLDRTLSKDQILEIYLNESPYGGRIYGVTEASRSFFGKEPGELSVAEAAYIASLPQAPSFYSPYGNHKDRLENRKNLVLRRMRDNNFLNEEEYQTALAEKIEFLPQSEKGILAPHFVFYIAEYLESKYGKQAILENGLKIITTLDYDLQQKAEKIVNRYATQNEKDFNAENASLVAVDPKTGEILVMVGSRNYFDKEIDGNFNIALAHRQPGSAFKPFVYATAFKKGYTPQTVLFDVKTEFSTTCSPDGSPLSSTAECYHPENYDNIFRGPVTMKNSLAQSLNIPSVKTLYLAGMNESLKTARDMGITTLTDPARYGLTLVLGGGEVSLLELTGAYGAFANEGTRNPNVGILQIEDSKGNILEEFKTESQQALDADIARSVSDILSDNEAREPLFGNASPLYFPGRDVAAKTGTTNDYRDAWIIGYTPNIAVGAWAGNNDNSPMEKKVAGFIIAPLWNAFMKEALSIRPNERFTSPEPISSDIKPVLRGIWQGGQTQTIDKTTGQLATDQTLPQNREERVVKSIHNILYWVNKNDPRGETPINPQNDSQFERWEYAVQKWLSGQGIKEENTLVTPTIN